MNYEMLATLPRLPLYDVHEHEGAKVAVFVGGQALVGELVRIPANTRGNTTLGFNKTEIYRRNGRHTKNGRIALWGFREPYGKNKGFAILATAGQEEQS